MILTKLYKDFFNSEKSGGFLLIGCTILSIILANSSFGTTYHSLFQYKLVGMSIEHIINDGLMAIFFLLIGLELEREVYIGELSSIKDALLPIFGAIGGILVPACIYIYFNYGTSTQTGIGIPMATDIAFALGILSLLGNKVPPSLKIFLTALAVIDDLAAIIVIALFYTKTLVLGYLFISLGIFAVLIVFNRLKIKNIIPYLIGGIAMWYFMLNSGVHATISGVLLAFAIPFGNGDEKSTSYLLQKFLHKPVAFFILPIFALANTIIFLDTNLSSIIMEKYSLGILLGLVLGKPIGILIFTLLSTRLGLCKLPEDLSWRHILGASTLAGIGFTMSIFITLLAFEDVYIINNTKLVILASSTIAAIFGYSFLRYTLKNNPIHE